jgi:Glycosyl transferase family 2
MTADPAGPDPAPRGAATVSVVLPCLNEEHSVGACVAEAFGALASSGYRGEVIVVDNNSTDGSAAVARRAGARVVAQPIPGYGAALRAGFAAAGGDVIVMADSDGTYPLSRLSELVDGVVIDGIDLMIGARLASANAHSMPFLHRYVGTPALTRLVGLAGADTTLTDSQSGFRSFRKASIDSLDLSSTGMELASEMLIRAGQRGLTMAEVPLGYREREGDSKLRTWTDGARHFRLIMQLGPHVALWYPGLILMLVSAFLLTASLFYPEGLAVGEVLWQPVFAASILAVVGVCATTAGALLAAYGPGASESVRARFEWVSVARTARRLRFGALALVAVGVALDVSLFVRSVAGSPALGIQLQLATVAQVALVVGSVLLMVATLQRVLLDRVRPA